MEGCLPCFTMPNIWTSKIMQACWNYRVLYNFPFLRVRYKRFLLFANWVSISDIWYIWYTPTSRKTQSYWIQSIYCKVFNFHYWECKIIEMWGYQSRNWMRLSETRAYFTISKHTCDHANLKTLLQGLRFNLKYLK